jgi:hypothetical protein
MAQQTESGFENLTSEQLLAVARQLLNRREVEVRRSIASGIGRLIVAGILLTIGGFLACGLRDGGAALISLLFLLPGLYNLIRGFIWIVDRSPVLILAADALVDCRSYPQQRYLWSNIQRARLQRTTRNGSEESATLRLYLLEAVGGQKEVKINLAELSHTSEGIFQMIGQRADLR